MKLYVISLVLLSLLISCENTNDTFESKNNLIPFKVGNKWTYKTELNKSIIMYSIIIIGDTVIDNKLWYNYNKVGLPNFINYFEDGIYELSPRNPETNEISLKFKFPANKGETYKFFDSYEVTVLSTGKWVVVEAGKFWCYEYEFKYDDRITIYSIAPGIGVVNEHWLKYDENGEVERESNYELIEYELN